MLTRTELNYLKGLKRFGGMPYDQIEFELVNLIADQNGHKILKRKIGELENRLNKAEKKIEEFKKTINKKDKKIFDLSIKKDQKKICQIKRGTCVKTANVHQLKRIELLLEDSKEPMNAYHIYKACGMRKEQCVSGLNYLVHHKLIQVEKGEYFK